MVGAVSISLKFIWENKIFKFSFFEYIDHKVKVKLFLYIINFVMIVILYKLYVTNNLSIEDYMSKFLLFFSWIVILAIFEKNLFHKL